METKIPIPASHRTFTFGNIIIDSNFDSGNCALVEKNSNTNFNIHVCADHNKYHYRSWFYFSLKGLSKSIIVSFNIKNMQNQIRLLYEGLQPVYRQQNDLEWKRITEKISLSGIVQYENDMEWSFKHTMTSNNKVYFALFYPWSTIQNTNFLKQTQQKCRSNKEIYFNFTTIIRSLQGRPVQFVTISSTKNIIYQQECIENQYLFKEGSKPLSFGKDKKCIIITARVHPGEVPGSHVMTGIIKELTSQSYASQLLRNKFVFYIFPILNPDGVVNGHYRVDTNGMNLNRCYINPNPSTQSPIYAVKNIVMHTHKHHKFFAFLDLHAQASRNGTFIYGNSMSQLQKQVQTCIFPKILSHNSHNFEYESSNFTEKNMYTKDKGDHISKEGSGRVAIFKTTKNSYCWTLECSYNKNRVLNVLQKRRNASDQCPKLTENNLSTDIILSNYSIDQLQTSAFLTIKDYHQLGSQICESFLDLISCNPYSRIDNPHNFFQSIQYMKMNLAIALLRMAPGRFQNTFKKIYYYAESKIMTEKKRAIKALYLLIIQKNSINNIQTYLKDTDNRIIVYPKVKNQGKKIDLRCYKSKDAHSQTKNIQQHQQIKQMKQKFPIKKKITSEKKKNLKQNKIKKNESLTTNFMRNILDQDKQLLQKKTMAYSKIMLEIGDIKIGGGNKWLTNNSHNKQELKNSNTTNKSIQNFSWKIDKIDRSIKSTTLQKEFPTLNSGKARTSMMLSSMKQISMVNTTQSCNKRNSDYCLK